MSAVIGGAATAAGGPIANAAARGAAPFVSRGVAIAGSELFSAEVTAVGGEAINQFVTGPDAFTLDAFDAAGLGNAAVTAVPSAVIPTVARGGFGNRALEGADAVIGQLSLGAANAQATIPFSFAEPFGSGASSVPTGGAGALYPSVPDSGALTDVYAK